MFWNTLLPFKSNYVLLICTVQKYMAYSNITIIEQNSTIIMGHKNLIK